MTVKNNCLRLTANHRDWSCYNPKSSRRARNLCYRSLPGGNDIMYQRIAPVTGRNYGGRAIAVVVAVATVTYLLLVVRGVIPSANRLTGAEFGMALIAVVLIAVGWRPDFLDRLQRFDFGGIKFELGEVKKGQIEVQKNQQEQQAVLEDIRLALRLLIGKNEQDHLINLFKKTTGSYRVKGALRDEIRRLRAMRLLKMREGKTVGGMPDKATFDLEDFVELTEDGFRFVSHLTNQPDFGLNTGERS